MKRDLIHIAVECAGGLQEVATTFGVTRQAISAWALRGAVPPARIKPLCDAGDNIITPERLLAYIADCRAEQARSRAMRNAAAHMEGDAP